MPAGIIINSNIASLNAQRRLEQNTQSLQQNFTRLSSGLRINKASDDAAGLAVSEMLRVDAVVYAQGVRNLNDAVSLINIAEGGVRQLADISIRQRELATQAANGTLNSKQRQALDQEANALVDEFNRIVNTVEFNGQKVLSSCEVLQMQAGYGAEGALFLQNNEALSRTVGAGTFAASANYTAGSNPTSLTFADLNGDGSLDMLATTDDGFGSSNTIYFNAGDGTLGASTTLGTLSGMVAGAAGDLNNDGRNSCRRRRI